MALLYLQERVSVNDGISGGIFDRTARAIQTLDREDPGEVRTDARRT
jgi:hypothetical protein